MKVLGVLITIAAIVAAVYLGVWVLLIGGIIEIVNAVQKSPVPGSEVAIGIVKIVFCETPAIIAWAGFAIAAWIWDCWD